jgi:cell division protein FtsB
MRTPHARAQIRKRHETDFWRAVNRFLVFLIGIGGVIVISMAFVPELRRIDEMKATLAGLQKDLANQQLLLAQQQRQERWLNESPGYVELKARDLLGVMKEGETMVRIDEPVPAAPAQAEIAPAAAK